METFTPIASTLGGVLIGLGAAGLLLLHGRIAGISGMLESVWASRGDPRSWQVGFLVGLVLAAVVLSGTHPSAMAVEFQASTPVLAGAGLLVGLGTSLGRGCTSGHGVCGLSLRSPRSATAVATFMGTAAVTVYGVRHVLGSWA